MGLRMLTLLMLLMGCQKDYSGKEPPVVKNGVIDLTGWDFEKDGSVKLRGDWKFWWKEEPAELQLENWNRINTQYFVPSEWETSNVNSESVKEIGWAVYGLKFIGLKKGQIISLPKIYSSFRIQVISQFGKRLDIDGPGTFSKSEKNSIPWRQPFSLLIPGEMEGRVVVLIYVSNYHDNNGGIVDVPKISSYEKQAIETNVRFSLSGVTFGMLLILGFYHMSLFFHRKEDKASLYLALWVFFFALRLFHNENLHTLVLTPSVNNYHWGWKLEYWGIATQGFFAMFIHKSFPIQSRILPVRLFSVSTVLLFVVILIAETKVVMKLTLICQLLSVFVLVFCNITVLRAVRAKISGANFALFGFIFLWASMIHDILVQQHIIDPPYLLQYGFLCFFICQSQVVSLQFKATYDRASWLVKELEVQERARTTFFHNTSHELRTPLNGILGFLELVNKGHFGAVSESSLEALRKVENLAKSLKMQVNTILDLARSKKGHLSLVNSEISLKVLLEDIDVIAIGLSLKRKKLKWQSSLTWDQCSEGTFVGDREKIFTILRNLIGNSFKFSRSEISNNISLILIVNKDGNLKVTVSDTGIGIPKDQQQRVFGEFTQVDDDSRRSFEGTGLGLTLVRDLVKLMNGTIVLESEENQGTTVTVEIPRQSKIHPVHIDDENSESMLVSTIRTSEKKERSIKYDLNANQNYEILVVDDNEINCEVVENILEAQGYKVTTSPGGRETMAFLESNTPDLILLDLMMPEVSGEDVLREVRTSENLKEIPIVLLTARASQEDRLQGLGLGADDYLAKPIISEELVIRVRNILYRVEITRMSQNFFNNEKMAQIGELTGDLTHEIRNAIGEGTGYERTMYLDAIRDQLRREPIKNEKWRNCVDLNRNPYVEIHEAVSKADLAENLILHSNEKRAILGKIISILSCFDIAEDVFLDIVRELISFDQQSLQNFSSSLFLSDNIIRFYDQTERTTEIISNILSFSSNNVIENVDATLVIDRSIALCKFKILSENIRVENEHSHKSQIFVISSDIQQILVNLLLNSIDALKESKTIKSVIRIGTEETKDYVKVLVEDNAGGISEHLVGRIFERNFTTKGEKGNGRGLFICQKIAKQNNTILSVNSENGKTTFVLLLPKANAKLGKQVA